MRTEHKHILHQFSQQVCQIKTLGDLVECITHTIQEMLHPQGQALILRRGDVWVVQQSVGLGLPTGATYSPGSPLASWLTAQRRPLDLAQETAWLASLDAVTRTAIEEVQADLYIPLFRGEQLNGWLALGTGASPYSSDDLDLLSMLVDQAIIAIANAQLYEQTDQALAQRVDDLSKLYQASLMLAFSTETYDVLKYIGKMAHELTRSDSVSIFIYNHQTDSFEPAAALGAGLPEDQGTCMRPAGMTRRAVTERRSFIIADTELETNLVNPAVRQAGIRSVICMPLISKGQVLGVMYVNSTQPNKYSDNDTQLISALANQAAVAIENGQLFKRMAQDHDRLQAVLDTTREGFMMLDTSGRIIFTNAMFGELFEMPSASLTGHRLADVIAAHAAELDDARSAMMDVIYDTLTELAEKTEAPHKSTVAMTYPPRFIERISLPVFDASGTVIGRLLTLRDITEEKKAEAMREDLMRMLVHDLRSPLTSILGGLQVLELELTDERHLRAIRVALQGSNRLLDLINALLDVNRMEAGQMPLKRQAVEWPALVSEATERVKSLAVNSKVTLQSEWATDLPAVYADQAVIIRVLINLLDNAIKYSPANAVIKVAVTHSNKETVCRVTDAGPGIPAEYQNRIFEKFFQVPNEAEKRRGTGLGLAFCRLAVEAHGGRIWIESAPGRGSTFAFTLPVEN